MVHFYVCMAIFLHAGLEIISEFVYTVHTVVCI